MKMMARATVTGVTQFQGNIDGENIDANTVFLLVDIQKGSGAGQRTAGRKAESKDVIDAFLATKPVFPCDCELDLLETATRGKENTLIVAIRPIAARKAA